MKRPACPSMRCMALAALRRTDPLLQCTHLRSQIGGCRDGTFLQARCQKPPGVPATRLSRASRAAGQGPRSSSGPFSNVILADGCGLYRRLKS
jgi:hypothetical protein